jgi:hypothetical protein
MGKIKGGHSREKSGCSFVKVTRVCMSLDFFTKARVPKVGYLVV